MFDRKRCRDSVVIGVLTDGSIAPKEALLTSASILQEFAGKVMVAMGISKKEVEQRVEEINKIEEEQVEEEEGNEMEDLRIEDLPISKRSKTGLLSGGYKTLGDLKSVSVEDLLNLSGFGNKFSEVAFENLFESNYSRFSKKMIQFSRVGNRAYYLNLPKNVNKLCLVGLVKDPISLCSYYKEKTIYPSPQEYKLELLVVQDILSSYNVSPDEQNNTKHDLSSIRQQKQISTDENNKGQENQ